MSTNPLFPIAKDGQTAKPAEAGEASARKTNPAANVVRQKLARLYAKEPDASKESQEAAAAKPRSKHQEFMYSLSSSGQSLAEIQTAWHNYYVGLPDYEKHQVWQEFYEANANLSQYHKYTEQHPTASAEHLPDGTVIGDHTRLAPSTPFDKRNVGTIRKEVRFRIDSRVKASTKSRLKSLTFGLAMGCLVIAIFLFSFFNEIIIAPFIQPSRHVSATPLILTSTTTVSTAPEVIIPKINVEIPVDYSQTSDDENAIENALESGVVHYPSTVLPGQNGNAAFFGHSSNNIFNPGQYKFAFVLLHTLVKGDVFYLNYQGTRYTYEVIDTKVVSPDDVAVLSDTEGQPATATLITCDPPGTSINRLIVTGKQISPDPSANTATPVPTQPIAQPTVLASNGPSLWSRLWNFIF